MSVMPAVTTVQLYQIAVETGIACSVVCTG